MASHNNDPKQTPKVTHSNSPASPDENLVAIDVLEIETDSGFEQVVFPIQKLISDGRLEEAFAQVEAGVSNNFDPLQPYYIKVIADLPIPKAGHSDQFIETLWYAGASGGVETRSEAIEALSIIAPADNRTLGSIKVGFESRDLSIIAASCTATGNLPQEVLESHPEIQAACDEAQAKLDHQINKLRRQLG